MVPATKLPYLPVIVTVPGLIPLTVPSLSTVATAVLLLAHVTALLVALLGATVAFNVKLAPSSIHGRFQKIQISK